MAEMLQPPNSTGDRDGGQPSAVPGRKPGEQREMLAEVPIPVDRSGGDSLIPEPADLELWLMESERVGREPNPWRSSGYRSAP